MRKELDLHVEGDGPARSDSLFFSGQTWIGRSCPCTLNGRYLRAAVVWPVEYELADPVNGQDLAASSLQPGLFLGVGELSQVSTHSLDPRRPDVQPGTDRAHRSHPPGRNLTRERLRAPRLQRIIVKSSIRGRIYRHQACRHLGRADAHMSSSWEPTSATVAVVLVLQL